jgi:hypothetical protein
MKSDPGLPMTVGNAAKAELPPIICCRSCGHQVEPDPVETARQHGAETAVLDWRERLACSRFGPGGRYNVEEPDPVRAGYPWCRASSQPQKVRFAPDSPLEEAVSSEPVSEGEIPC